MYAGLLQSPIFMIVIAVSIFCQVIIMNFLGVFFKVVPLVWQEWLVGIAIGFGSSIISWTQRFITRNFSTFFSASIVDLRRGGRVTSAQGRTTSGKSFKRVGSIVAGDMGSMRAAPGLDGKWGAGSFNGGGSGRGSRQNSQQGSRRSNSGQGSIVQPFVAPVSDN